MVKIRLHGTEEECQRVSDTLAEQLEILSISEPYPDRGQSKYVRVYIDAELRAKEQKDESI